MTSNEIADIILKSYFSLGRNIVTTNYSGGGLHEADVLMISEKSMFVYEYEIKRSYGDFKADFKKEEKHRKLSDKKYRESLFEKYKDNQWFTCPNYFYYACEKDIIPLEECPSYAGLIYIIDNQPVIVKKGKRLHNHKATDRLLFSILRNLSARFIYGCSYMNYKKKL